VLCLHLPTGSGLPGGPYDAQNAAAFSLDEDALVERLPMFFLDVGHATMEPLAGSSRSASRLRRSCNLLVCRLEIFAISGYWRKRTASNVTGSRRPSPRRLRGEGPKSQPNDPTGLHRFRRRPDETAAMEWLCGGGCRKSRPSCRCCRGSRVLSSAACREG
jgi:hypothetical protein